MCVCFYFVEIYLYSLCDLAVCGCCYCRQSAGWWQHFLQLYFVYLDTQTSERSNTGENLHHVITINNSQLYLYPFNHESVHQLQLPCLQTITHTHTQHPAANRQPKTHSASEKLRARTDETIRNSLLLVLIICAWHSSMQMRRTKVNSAKMCDKIRAQLHNSHSMTRWLWSTTVSRSLTCKFFSETFQTGFCFFFRCSPITICRISLVFF